MNIQSIDENYYIEYNATLSGYVKFVVYKRSAYGDNLDGEVTKGVLK